MQITFIHFHAGPYLFLKWPMDTNNLLGFFLAISDFKDDRFFLEISDQQGRPIQLPDSERKVIGHNSSLQDKGQPVLVQLGSERHYRINVILFQQ